MRRTQIYLSDEQRALIKQLADSEGVAQAVIVRRILDEALGIDDGAAGRLAAIDATAGALSEMPDWPDWLEAVRGRTASERLDRLGL